MEELPASFDFVAEVLDGRIRDICAAVGATEEPVLYFTGKENFRYEVAVTKPYKGTRKDEKPFHYENLKHYIINQYHYKVDPKLEADDLMSIDQDKYGLTTVICSRDKDLRMVPGWHYGWECGKQREFGPLVVDDPGMLSLSGTKPPKLTGYGKLFFYAQLLMGDSVDNIPGCPGIGAKKAYDILNEPDGRSPWEKVRATYESKNCTEEYLLEQGQLLWMIREVFPNGEPKMWQLEN